jgi:hypothetical protein
MSIAIGTQRRKGGKEGEEEGGGVCLLVLRSGLLYFVEVSGFQASPFFRLLDQSKATIRRSSSIKTYF